MTTTTTAASKLTAPYALAGFPTSITMGELVALAKAKLGKAYAGVVTATYGGGTQVEVRKYVNGYHGRRVSRVQCYAISD